MNEAETERKRDELLYKSKWVYDCFSSLYFAGSTPWWG